MSTLRDRVRHDTINSHGRQKQSQAGTESSEGPSLLGLPDGLVGAAAAESAVLLLGDPYTFPVDLFLNQVNENHPGLRVLCAEGGFAWLPSLMWRFDRLWRGLRREIPWTTRRPSAASRS